MTTQPTISDVARVAGVSVATVSRALRDLDKVHPETRARVLAATQELSYIGSPDAAGLASGRSRLIGIITPFMSRWFFAGIMSAIEKVFRDHNHHILLMDLEEKSPEARLSLTQGRLFKRVDGLIVINVELEAAESELVHRLDLPVIAVGYPFETAPRIGIDDHGCAALATRHLVNLGHSAIAYVGKARAHNPHGRTPNERLRGFEETLAASSLTVRPEWVLESDWSVGDAYAGATHLLAQSQRPTSVVCGSDEMALGVMAAALDAGLRVPEDLSVVGIDDHDMAAVFGLTTVRQPVADQGRAAALAMLGLLGLTDVTPEADHNFPVDLIIRRSTAAP